MALKESSSGTGTTVAVLAEKPSVARDLARVLGATKQGEGYLHGNGYVVTWAIGHLAALAQPHEIQAEWRQWRRDTLPMLPRTWPLVIYDRTKDQFETVKKILNSPKCAEVVCATDAGREGELIFRYIYEAAGCDKPFKRLWISSLTPDAIKAGFEKLKAGREYDQLADAARGRSRADWLVGMNLSRAYSLAYSEDLSVGRVQTPTLAMVVERELQVRSFVPEDYQEVVATFRPETAGQGSEYAGTWFGAPYEPGQKKEQIQPSMRLAADGEQAREIVERAKTGVAAIESVEPVTQRAAPPPLYDLTELQRHANRLFGFSAQKTLDVAQSLYEKFKAISYPRTDSRHLSKDVAATLGRVVQAVAGPYQKLVAPGTGERPLSKRFVDDTKVSDHHAIIPTAGRVSNLPPDEARVYDLICRRLLSCWHDDHIWSVTTVITAIRNGEVLDRYHSSGTAIEQVGWKVLDPPSKKKDEEAELPGGLRPGQAQEVVDAKAVRKKTRAPKRFTEATLLTAMETAGKTLDEKELSDAMKDNGLGTPATRANIIEVLLKRGYLERVGKTLEATDKGIRLIDVVHPEVKSPAMTGQWEAFLGRIHKGADHLEPFLTGIEDYVREVVGKVSRAPIRPRAVIPPKTKAEEEPGEKKKRTAKKASEAAEAEPVVAEELGELSGRPLEELLQRVFGFEKFRPNQRAVIEQLTAGKDTLLVMSTGSGKSLCYQLPGLARGGTTLVVSPLIALMEDQVAKLRSRGLKVECIHSNQERAVSRQACIRYLAGDLHFLFVAPERLRVPGFPEMLAKRKPALVAIDEAHCISQWGHDFRPDYRMLGQHLPNLRPAPVIALTATATPRVQDDISEQLGLTQAQRSIHGFRRDNIAVEVVEVAPSNRARLACELLLDESRRPGIVYTPTRKMAEAVTAELAAHFPTATYHAGLDGETRKRVQERFLAGDVEVMVATIAFGMGIDKPDVRTVIHTALPGCLEAYYQELGRAGRDGEPSRVVLMHSYADRHTHDFFFERDYPEPRVLELIASKLGSEPVAKELLKRQTRLDEEVFEKALERLWTNGGAVIDYAENVSPGAPGWRLAYERHLEQKRAQIEEMIRYAESNECRMAALVRHFGDLADAKHECGMCDFCAPEECIAQRFRPPTGPEKTAFGRVMDKLQGVGLKSTGKLHGELFPTGGMTRDSFEDVLGALARAGLVRLDDAVFEKDGRKIPYRTVKLTVEGEDWDPETELDLMMKEAMAAPAKKGGKRKAVKKTAKKEAPKRARKQKALPEAEAPVRAAGSSVGSGTFVEAEAAPMSALEETLRAWRLAEAKKKGVPAFRIFTDKTLREIAERRPQTAAELIAIPGVGLKAVETYGRALYRMLAGK